ncbi:MAG: PD-(D/E)XK nuclease family protein, partial [Bdellovibrionaceae bacterium]|nr:PD-(D/E)XK nuclease family protein [Pseudobdellovibrionaceae bacterium]
MKKLDYEEKYGLLTACKKYGGENYLTEVWAWILQNNRLLLVSFIKEIFDISLDHDPIIVETQKYIFTESSAGFIDLVITTSEYCFIFEHKINHSYGEDQILKYIDSAQKRGFSVDKIMSATISGYFIDHSETVKNSNMVIANYLWHELFKFIDKK